MKKRLRGLRRCLWFGLGMALMVGWGGSAAAQNGSPLDGIEVLDLPTAAKIALAGNPSLAAARERVNQAREVLQQARAAYWPRLDATATASQVNLSNNAYQQQLLTARIIDPQATLKNPEEYYSAGLQLSWLLFDGFARKFNLAAARYGQEASTAARDDAQRLLLSAVTNAFLSAQLAQENIAIAKADEAFNQRQLTEAQLRYKVGTGALSNVLNFQVKVNQAKALRIQADQAFHTALVSLAALLGLPQSALPQHVRLASLEPAAPTELATPQLDAILDTAFKQRPDLQQNDRVVQQAQAGVEVARAGYYPNLSFSADWTGERAGDTHFSGDDFGDTLALTLSYNIFAGGLTRARHQEAKARLNEVEKSLQSAKVSVASEVQRVVTQVLSAQQQLSLQQANADLVQQNRDLVEKEYKAGVGSLVRLNEAQRDLIAAQVSLASARAALHQAWYDMQAATGEILATFR